MGRRRRAMLATLAALVLAGAALTLMVGQSLTPPVTVLRVFLGLESGGEAFTVGVLRGPRVLVSALAGMCFGLGGVAFQTLLRNPLASPDIIGISSGASAAAVFCIVMLGLSGTAVSVVAVAAGLGVALLIYLLAWKGGAAGARLILVGIGIAAMLQSFTAYVLTQAPTWSLQQALRWMTGSVNGAQLAQALPLAVALAVFGGALLALRRDLETLRMGEDTAAALGVRIGRVRLVVICAAVGLVAFATAATGPIAFVAFLSGPIAARLLRRDGSLLLPAALTGAALVLLADFAGQVLLPARYPVGIVTGVLGAPYLVALILRDNRKGGAL
ncbi:FecCD family ABC transporter permease [Vannielia litorea]|uniref:FecCD family ABC transporter permease n=1 Tax=Vannielia litorea TaxID=1217970 RepID=UPI001C93FF09|nr:iron ABC transporter permease [Vannielia litorea]MBY6046721.1 iron ABC transporter permease [Vannielia litorea]MBY6074135.1 iron ABC transporter permease [Vannielia litorea]